MSLVTLPNELIILVVELVDDGYYGPRIEAMLEDVVSLVCTCKRFSFLCGKQYMVRSSRNWTWYFSVVTITGRRVGPELNVIDRYCAGYAEYRDGRLLMEKSIFHCGVDLVVYGVCYDAFTDNSGHDVYCRCMTELDRRLDDDIRMLVLLRRPRLVRDYFPSLLH
jgi:hypothetical protein